MAGRQGFEPRYHGPETAAMMSAALGRVVFPNKIAWIVGASQVDGGPFVRNLSRFCQEFGHDFCARTQRAVFSVHARHHPWFSGGAQ
jgi:hypothetical protein